MNEHILKGKREKGGEKLMEDMCVKIRGNFRSLKSTISLHESSLAKIQLINLTNLTS